MRAMFFRGLVRFHERHMLSFFRRIQLQVLANVTADAFGVKAPRLWQKNPEKALADYAAFTRNCMEVCTVDAERMYRLSYQLGYTLRRITGFSEREDLQRLVFLLYRNIGITMQGELPGCVTVSECYFSQIYTPQQCRMISSMDSGIVSGICGGVELTFTQRLTEGCDHCTACLKVGTKDE